MNDDNLWDYYSGLPNPKFYEMEKCEICNKPMSQEDYDFCDICGDCFDADVE
jgi:hypothetical protein|tara:strand:- start:233 stop:388 length:156 start_codon:yes stop_codon:yes gene_type:complete